MSSEKLFKNETWKFYLQIEFFLYKSKRRPHVLKENKRAFNRTGTGLIYHMSFYIKKDEQTKRNP